MLHSNGAHWGRFVRTIVEVETADGLSGSRRDGRRRRGRRARVRGARRLPARPRCVPAGGDALRDLQPDGKPLQQPHPASRGDRVRLPRHHRARSSACRCTRSSAAKLRDEVEFASYLFFRYNDPVTRRGEVRTRRAARRPCARTRGRARLPRAQAQGRRVSAGARARLLSRAGRRISRRALSLSIPTARCRSPTRSTSDAASLDLRNDYFEDPVWGMTAARAAQGIRAAADGDQYGRRELRAARRQRRDARRRRDPARHDVLGRHPPMHQGRGRLRDNGRSASPCTARASSASSSRRCCIWAPCCPTWATPPTRTTITSPTT